MKHRAVDGELTCSFTVAGEVWSERQFFEHVADHCPKAAPALRRLVDAYARSVEGQYVELFTEGEKGIGILAYAVTALGMLDASALPTIQRYGANVDREHEYWFAQATVPKIVEMHGWTESVLDFVLWVMQRSFYNSLQDYSIPWLRWACETRLWNASHHRLLLKG